MKIAYFDCFSGISGDMCLGALVDAGVPLEEIERGLKGLKLKGYGLRQQKVVRAGIAATKVDVKLNKAVSGQRSAVRKWKDIQQIIKESSLPENIKRQGLTVFKNLFEAEAKVHGSTIEKTHLHELGCVDCLVDIFGTLIGLSILGIDNVYTSPINLGSGSTKTSHGILSVPAPATAELLKGIPCYSSGPAFEMTTPTGAVLIKTLSSGFGSMPLFRSETIGVGAGNKDPEERPNILRIMVGESDKTIQDETVTVIETNIDDMNPQIYEYVMERLFGAGALDVSLTQVIMKKSRPGVLLTVLCNTEKKNDLISIIFKETTTIGVRCYDAGRITMKREIKQIQNRYGKVSMKRSVLDSSIKITPEYDDCKRIALNTGLSLLEVMDNARKAKKGKRQT